MIGLTEDEIGNIVGYVDSFDEVSRLILFGSRAMGNHKPGSDVDLCVLGNNVSIEVVGKLSYLLNQESDLPYFFDVINYAAIDNDSLRTHINQQGVVIWEKENDEGMSR